MNSELRAVALDAPDIDRLATFYEDLAGWRRAPGAEDDWAGKPFCLIWTD